MSDQGQHKTILGADCRLTGELSRDNDAVIMGQFKGTLRVRGILELAESSRLEGTIVAGVVRLAGTADADLIAEHSAELLPTARLTGQIFTVNLNVMEGAVYQGDVHVGPKALESAAVLLSEQREDEAAPASPSAPAAAPASAQTLVLQNEAASAADPTINVSESLEALLSRRRPRILTPTPIRRVAAAPLTVQAKAS